MIMITCKPMTEMSPQVKLREFLLTTGGTNTAEIFGGAVIAVNNEGAAKTAYVVDEDFSQELTASNQSGNTVTADYPTLVRTGAFEGRDVVTLSRGNYKKQLNLNFQTLTSSNVKSASAIDEGDSYLRYSYEWLAAKHAAGGAAAVFSGETRNPLCWLAEEDLTGIPYSNSTSGNHERGGALIAPRYLAGVNHFPIAVGATVTFKTSDGSNVVRTVIGASETGTGAGDLRICVLDSDVPAGVKIYPVAGRWLINAESAGSYFDTRNQFCGVFINRERDASYIHKCDFETLPWPKSTHIIGGVTVTDAITTMYLDAIWSGNKLPEFAALSSIRINPSFGDSGSAILVKVAGGLAAASVFTSPNGGPFFDEAYINACIASARLDAIVRGNGTPNLQTVTVAPDPTL